VDGCGCDPGFEIFDESSATADADRYRRHGPDATTRMLLDMIREHGISGLAVLDIGGGIGVIDHELLREGAGHAVLVDASPPSLEVARDEARRRGSLDRIDFVDGDFVAHAASIAAADVVTLDRVICCYHDMPALTGAAAAKARRILGLVYPRDTWWVRAAVRAENAVLWMQRTPFRVFAHRTAVVDAVVRANGLEPSFARNVGFWQVIVYARRAGSPQTVH